MQVEVPGRKYDYRPGGEPSQLVSLPLQVRPRRALLWCYALIFFFVGLLGLLLLLIPPSPNASLSYIITMAFGVFCLVMFTGLALTVARDALRPAVLTIEAAGYRDHRLGVSVAWNEVEAVDYRAHGSLVLTLRDRLLPRRSYFRHMESRWPANKHLIPLQFVRPNIWTVASLFMTMIERAGGAVSNKVSMGFNKTISASRQ
jgi:hypothetical protein